MHAGPHNNVRHARPGPGGDVAKLTGVGDDTHEIAMAEDRMAVPDLPRRASAEGNPCQPTAPCMRRDRSTITAIGGSAGRSR